MPLDDKYRISRSGSWAARIEVHRNLGPGLLESTYRACLQHELNLQGFRVSAEVPIPVSYKGLAVEASYRADLIVDETVLLELKAVEQLLPVHSMQTLTYLKLAKVPIGFLINFNVPCLKQGVRRFANLRSSPERAAVAPPPRS
jgi:GxxExxY protein